MSKEKSLFTVSEDEKDTEEMICVSEDEQMPIFTAPASDKQEEDTDWRSSKHPKHFIVFLINEINRLPKPTMVRGNKSMLEKALGQYKQLDSYISQALRSDYDDDIDASKIDEIRRMVEAHTDEIQEALDGIDLMTKNRRQMRRRRGENESDDLVKEATAPAFNGIQIQLSSFERAVVGALINGAVSGGRNMEELYKEAKEKYNFTPREELAIFQILMDFGYPTFKDRLTIGDKNTDPTRTDDLGEWQSQYYA